MWEIVIIAIVVVLILVVFVIWLTPKDEPQTAVMDEGEVLQTFDSANISATSFAYMIKALVSQLIARKNATPIKNKINDIIDNLVNEYRKLYPNIDKQLAVVLKEKVVLYEEYVVSPNGTQEKELKKLNETASDIITKAVRGLDSGKLRSYFGATDTTFIKQYNSLLLNDDEMAIKHLDSMMISLQLINVSIAEARDSL